MMNIKTNIRVPKMVLKNEGELGEETGDPSRGKELRDLELDRHQRRSGPGRISFLLTQPFHPTRITSPSPRGVVFQMMHHD